MFYMAEQIGGYDMFEKVRPLPEIVAVTTPAANSMLGRYFIGQSGLLQFRGNDTAWAGLINPISSGVNLYFDIFTITNFSDKSFNSEIWLNANPQKKVKVSSTVTPANQTISPPKRPKVIMAYVDNMEQPLLNGVNIFGRIVPENSTLVSDSHQGSIIIPPGGSFSILLKSNGTLMQTSTIVLTWWEEDIRK